MRYNRIIAKITLLATGVLIFSSCSNEQSQTTGWEYNNEQNGGFEVVPYEEQETGPGLVLVEGGTFLMGRTEQDVRYDWNNIPRRVSVSSFYLDQTEVRNLDYLEYLYWLKRIYGIDYPRIIKKALPDTLVWRDKLAYNEPYVDYYLRHPAYRDYPVVGVSWVQARDYCAWRTDRVNELILINYGILRYDVNQQNMENFNTDAYFAGQYEGAVRNDLIDLNPTGAGTRKARMTDGILLPKYRLPTEAEWEFAALGLIGNTLYERIVERRLYPWNGHITRTDANKNYGDFVANFKRGRGDNMGVAGNLNDAGDITTPVYAYWPNDYGLYNMAGNVSEWVLDVYRPLSLEDFTDFRPYRGNVFETQVRNNSDQIDDKLDYIVYDYAGISNYLIEFQQKVDYTASDEEKQLLDKLIVLADEAIKAKEDRLWEDASLKVQDLIDEIDNAPETVTIGAVVLKGISGYIVSTPGQLKMRPVTVEENLRRRNYRESDNIGYLDGDVPSRITADWTDPNTDDKMYDYGATSMINDEAMVYKGASWRDRAYWLSPGTRRFLDKNQSKDYIGFRCAMTRVGSPIGKY
ncbi:MAG: SUMF1/EgtB/PvdO family nonheme iron enzyme [Saprospiraceae bacterium]|nr:SUMF1/EgtB/PvdO family nonheme iron enzyme [Saprospiraceae bacterium]